MVSLLDLPSELLLHIISFLTEDKPPSAKLLHEEASDSFLRSDYHPLKDFSRACRATRGLSFPILFSALKVDLNSVDAFLEFVNGHDLSTPDLSTPVDSIVLYLSPHPQSEKSNIWLRMVQVIDSTGPSVSTVVLTASQFERILPYRLNLKDQWAFGIRHQVLQLIMPRHLAAPSQTPQEIKQSQNVFWLREWTHCTFNQGSSIDVYSSYDYFLKETPSIFNPQVCNPFEHTMARAPLFANLTSLDYIAIFPIDCMAFFTMCIISMKNLKCLRVRFAPTDNNNVLDNPAAVGKCQPGDLWQEFETCYKALTELIRRLRNDGILKSLEEFVSLDYTTPSLRELLHRVIGPHLADMGSFRADSHGGHWALIQ